MPPSPPLTSCPRCEHTKTQTHTHTHTHLPPTLTQAKLEVLEDDLAREKFREKLRQDNVAHTEMFEAIKAWVEVKQAYLAVPSCITHIT